MPTITREAWRASGTPLPRDQVWQLLEGFFETEMSRQTLVPGARQALEVLAKDADIVVLTNLGDRFNTARALQLRNHGIVHRIVTNQGGHLSYSFFFHRN